MSTLSTSAPSCSRHSVLRVRPSSAVWCRTTVSSPGSSASVSASRASAGQVGHLRRVGDAAVEVPGQLVGAEGRVPELGDRRAGLLAGEVGEVARGHAPAGGVEDERAGQSWRRPWSHYRAPGDADRDGPHPAGGRSRHRRRRPVAGSVARRTPATTPSCSPHGDRRNVVDRYRYWTVEAIVADLDRRRHPFHVAIENWRHDLNIGTVVRTANAFLAEAVHIVGKKRWNRRGAMVTDRYQHVRHHPDVAGAGRLGARRRGCRCWPSTTCRAPGRWRRPSSRGPACCCSARRAPACPTEAREAADGVLSIAQFGSTRSINAGGGRRHRHARLDQRQHGRDLAGRLTAAAPGPADPARQRQAARRMSRLADVDLSVSLSKKDAKEQLKAAQERLVHLRLLLGGQIGPGELGPPLLRALRGLGRLRQGRRDPAAGRRARPPARPGRPVRRPHPRREAAPLPLAVLAGAARAGAAWPCSTAPGTAGCWSSGSRASPPRRPWQRAYDEIVDLETTLAAEGTILVKFWMHLSPEEQLRRFESRRDDPYRAWKLTDEDWRNREKRAAVRGGRRGHARAHRPPRRRPGTSSPREDKRWARVDVVRTVCEAIESALADARASTPTRRSPGA